MGNAYHTTVLLEESINALNIKAGERYIDGTLGGGGHTGAILERGGIVLGIDTDQDAIGFAQRDLRLKIKGLKIGKDLVLAKGNFRDIDIIAREAGFEKVKGIIFDLGVSSYQVDKQERGFSFQNDGPLDMRMDREAQKIQASDLVNALSRTELNELFYKLGEERFARRIAASIIEERSKNPIKTTAELSAIVRRAVPKQNKNINPATKVFQALRIAVNDEINNLRVAMPKALELLEAGGRLTIISFHSLEDRVVKHQFKDWEQKEMGKIITKKPVAPSAEEMGVNYRSRSSKLRVFEKI